VAPNVSKTLVFRRSVPDVATPSRAPERDDTPSAVETDSRDSFPGTFKYHPSLWIQ